MESFYFLKSSYLSSLTSATVCDDFTEFIKTGVVLADNALRNYKSSGESDKPSGKLLSLGNKIPPHSIDAEVAVIGSLMLDRQAISKVIEILTEESFYVERHRVIYKAIMLMFNENISVDLITLNDRLTKNGDLDNAGGPYYLSKINEQTPSSAHVEHHAYIVQEKFLKRKLIQVSGEILENGYDDTKDALEEIDIAESKIFEIAEKRFRKSYTHIKKLAHDTYNIIEELQERQDTGLTGIPSGFKDLDNLLGGFQNSDFIIIAGRPSMGKTALALSIARNTSLEYKNPVAFFSIEMASSQLVIRLLSAEAKINQQNIRTGKLKSSDTHKIIQALGRLSDSPLYIDDSPMLSILELRAKCRRLKAEHGIKMVVVDYLQLVMAPKSESREREISIISQSMKQIAKELEIPVIALAQLNRAVESRTDKRPMLSDLRESGSIEQDADVVMFVHRPEHYGQQKFSDDRPTEGVAEIIVGKQRNGPTGIARIAFMKDFARFENLTYDTEVPPDIDGMEDEEDAAPF